MEILNLYDLSVKLLGELPPQFEFMHFILIFIMAIAIICSVILIIKLSFNLLGGR